MKSVSSFSSIDNVYVRIFTGNCDSIFYVSYVPLNLKILPE